MGHIVDRTPVEVDFWVVSIGDNEDISLHITDERNSDQLHIDIYGYYAHHEDDSDHRLVSMKLIKKPTGIIKKVELRSSTINQHQYFLYCYVSVDHEKLGRIDKMLTYVVDMDMYSIRPASYYNPGPNIRRSSQYGGFIEFFKNRFDMMELINLGIDLPHTDERIKQALKNFCEDKD